MRSRLDHVRNEFAQHNLPLQALLGLLGHGERALQIAEALAVQPPLAEGPDPGKHPLDLALLGLLGLHERLLAELDARGLTPAQTDLSASTEPAPELPSPLLRSLAR